MSLVSERDTATSHKQRRSCIPKNWSCCPLFPGACAPFNQTRIPQQRGDEERPIGSGTDGFSYQSSLSAVAQRQADAGDIGFQVQGFLVIRAQNQVHVFQ